MPPDDLKDIELAIERLRGALNSHTAQTNERLDSIADNLVHLRSATEAAHKRLDTQRDQIHELEVDGIRDTSELKQIVSEHLGDTVGRRAGFDRGFKYGREVAVGGAAGTIVAVVAALIEALT